MALQEGEAHCALVSEAEVLRIAASGASADSAALSAPASPAQRYSVCDGQRANNRALQPRESPC